MEDLKAALADMSQFISLEVGDSFIGVYKGFKRVPNTFDTEKESIELTFTVNGSDKSLTSMSLPKFLVEADVKKGDNVRVKKVSKKGNTVVWSVDVIEEGEVVPDDVPPPTDADLENAGV